jgi:hypothetical protein
MEDPISTPSTLPLLDLGTVIFTNCRAGISTGWYYDPGGFKTPKSGNREWREWRDEPRVY